MFSNKKVLSKEIFGELRTMSRLIKEQEYLASVVASNSYFVHKGQLWLKTQSDIIALLIQKRSEFIASIAPKYGFKSGVAVTIDLEKGTIQERKGDDVEKPVVVPENVGEVKE